MSTVTPASSTAAGLVPDEQALVVPKRLEYLPIGLFGSVMSLTGLSVAWRLAQRVFDAPEWISLALGALSTGVFAALLLGYIVKCIHAPAAVRAEFVHPIIGNLFGTFFICLLLQPIVLVPFVPIFARVMWTVGAIAMTVFAWLMMTRWLSNRQQAAHATPAWIIPLVGMLDIPLALPALGLSEWHEVMVFSLAVGLFFAIPLFTMIMSRLLFEAPMPDALAPSLLVLLAPFAVGMSSYVVTVGQVDLFAEALFAIDVFVLAVLLGRLRYLRSCCPFRVSWWAVGFPLAASAIAGMRMVVSSPTLTNSILALVLLSLATAVILAVLLRTMTGVLAGDLRALSA